MNYDGWQKVREVFDAALRQPPENRLNYARQACGDDQDLLREVESLLASLDSSESFMEKPAVAHVADMIKSESQTLKPGTHFGHYKIIREIGIGGMGRVYVAKDEQLDRPVAIKILKEEVSRHESSLQRFVREAKAASALNHPNILVIHEIGEADDAHYIVSEFIEGRTLREILNQGSLEISQVLDISIQVASALHAAHEAHLVHRDIKPDNLMIRPDGYVKVLDFGLAKLVEKKQQAFLGFEESTVRQNQTAKGVILGTVNYMSPEQAKGEPIDQRTDIFSLGVVIYELVAGRPPFARDSISETLANLIDAEPQPLSRFAVNVPDYLNRIVSKMLRKNSDERYQTMKDVLTDLKELRTEMTVEKQLRGSLGQRETAGNTPGEPLRPKRAPASSHIGWRLVALGVVLVVVLAVIIIGWRQRRAGNAYPTEIRSLAVLPLNNLSGDANQDYFADGMTDALISKLAQISSLRIISRNSMMTYKGARKPTPQVARELKVDAVVDGTVVRSGERVRITVNLINASLDQHLWTKSYERDLREVLALQSEIARDVAQEIRVKLTPQLQTRLATARSVNAEAHEAYLKGLYYFNQGINERTEEILKKSTEYFQQAINLDPSYALAHAGLSRSYHWVASWGIRPEELYPKAKTAALKALELDETLAEAHISLGYILFHHEWDWAGCEREYKRAFELNSNERYHVYGLYLSAAGRHDEAIANIRQAEELDPLALPIKRNVGLVLVRARRYDEAIQQYQKVLELKPDALAPLYGLGNAYAFKGRYAEAVAVFQKAAKISGNNQGAKANLAWVYAWSGRGDEARKILAELEMTSTRESLPQITLATTYAALGEKDKAFTWLNIAYANHSPALMYLNVMPEFDTLRSDVRFQDLLRRIGQPG